MAGPLETTDASAAALCPLFLRLCGGTRVKTNAPRVVEITTFEQPEHKRMIVSLVNFPRDLPAVPVMNVSVTLRTGGARARQVNSLPSGATLESVTGRDSVSFTVPRLETFAMAAVELG